MEQVYYISDEFSFQSNGEISFRVLAGLDFALGFTFVDLFT